MIKNRAPLSASLALAAMLGAQDAAAQTDDSEINNKMRICGAGELVVGEYTMTFEAQAEDGTKQKVKIEAEFGKFSGGIHDAKPPNEDPAAALQRYQDYLKCIAN
jgi:hypothetical protein